MYVRSRAGSTEVANFLKSIDLLQYADAFVSNGFTTLSRLGDATEGDFEAMQVKLGERREIQRALKEYSAREAVLSTNVGTMIRELEQSQAFNFEDQYGRASHDPYSDFSSKFFDRHPIKAREGKVINLMTGDVVHRFVGD